MNHTLYKFPFLKSTSWWMRGELTADFQVGLDERSLFSSEIEVFFTQVTLGNWAIPHKI